MSGAGGNVVIAIDGPAGTGKSTVSRGVARALDARYLDTGSMYRIVTLAILRSGVDLDDPAAIAAAADVPLSVGFDPEAEQAYLADEDVSAEIRGDDVTRAVSAVSAVPRCVRGWWACSANWPPAPEMLWSRAATSAPWCCRRPI